MNYKQLYKYTICGILLILLLLSSCTAIGPHYSCTYEGKKFITYSIFRPFVGFYEYRGGYWSDWDRDKSLRFEVKSYPNLEITFYSKYKHPADFEYRIIAKSRRENDGVWEVYDGEIQIKKSKETSMRSKYTKDVSGVNALKDVWSFPATIKRTYGKLPEDKYIYPYLPTDMMYTYNVYYNGVGRAFCIDGIWVGADEYDPW